MSIYRPYFPKIFKRPCEGNTCIYFCFERLQPVVFKVLHSFSSVRAAARTLLQPNRT